MSLLPFNRRPGTDLLSKGIISDKRVIKIIEEGLDLETNEYQPAVNEWKNGQRSDVFLVANSLDLPPVIIEIENTVNDKAMRKTVDYAREAEKKTGMLPIVIIFNTNAISASVKSEVHNCNFQGFKRYPCAPWARDCLIFNKSNVSDVQKNNIIPLTALGLFLAEGDRSLALSQYREDATIKDLYTLAWKNLDTIKENEEKQNGLLEELALFCRKVKDKVLAREHVVDTVQYIDGFEESLKKRKKAPSDEEPDGEEEQASPAKKPRTLYTAEEKQFLIKYMGDNPEDTYEACRAAGASKGLFTNRAAKNLSDLHSRMKKKKKYVDSN